VIAMLRQRGIPHEHEHADLIEKLLETHAPSEEMVTLALSDDVYLRTYNWARLDLGCPTTVRPANEGRGAELRAAKARERLRGSRRQRRGIVSADTIKAPSGGELEADVGAGSSTEVMLPG
jgi:hypothetical protein